MRPEEQLNNPIQTVGAEPVREQDKIQLILSYIGILALIPLLTVKDSPYVKWHAVQGLVLGVGVGIAMTVVLALLGALTGGLLGFLACIAWPALIVVDIMACMKALKGERWRIPVVTDIAEKFLK